MEMNWVRWEFVSYEIRLLLLISLSNGYHMKLKIKPVCCIEYFKTIRLLLIETRINLSLISYYMQKVIGETT